MSIRSARRIALCVAAAALLATPLTLLPGCTLMVAPPTQAVSLLEPADGAVLSSPFRVRFGVRGMNVAPAGEVLPNSGHHHLVINGGAVPAGESVPFTERYQHFGKGQTETEVTLPPGVYQLTAQFANGAHQSYGQAMSQTITVTVK